MAGSELYADRVRAFTEHLVCVRRGKRITSTTLARALGISQPAVSKMEHAGQDWRLSTVLRYADAVGLVVVLAEARNVG